MNAITMIESSAISAPPQLAVGPMANAIAALQAGMTIEHLKGVMELQKEWEANEARKAYVSDMAAFKLRPPAIPKDKFVGYGNTGYFHATLGGVTSVVVDALAAHGFSHSWEVRQADGLISVTCRITHRMGHSESTTMASSPDVSGKKNSIQAIASAQTYLSRYTLLAATGLATMDMPDDDGRGYDDDRGNQGRPVVGDKPGPQVLAIYTDADFAAKLPGWLELIKSSKKTPERLIDFLKTKASLTTAQEQQILNATV